MWQKSGKKVSTVAKRRKCVNIGKKVVEMLRKSGKNGKSSKKMANVGKL
jgi:hypothetical protein